MVEKCFQPLAEIVLIIKEPYSYEFYRTINSKQEIWWFSRNSARLLHSQIILLTLSLSDWTRASKWLQNQFCEKPSLRISCIFFRFYPEINLYIHFWNQNSLTTKKSHFWQPIFINQHILTVTLCLVRKKYSEM